MGLSEIFFEHGITLIEDRVDCRAELLLKCFALKLAEKVDRLFWFYSDSSLSRATLHLESLLDDNRCQMYDLDAFLLNQSSDNSPFPSSIGDQRTAIVVDSLTSLLLPSVGVTPNVTTVARFLRRLSKVVDAFIVSPYILSVVHSELLTTTVEREQLRSLAKHWCVLSPSDYGDILCTTTIARSNGPPDCNCESFDVTNNPLQMINVRPYEPKRVVDATSNIVTTEVSSVENQPTAVAKVPFKLTLNEKEKAARERVTLPYTTVQSEDGLVGIRYKEMKSGHVYYTADEADDLDDSDPDDDLNI